MGENELLVNKKKRNELIERIEVLDSVGEVLLLGDTDFATTEMVANYYNVTQRHIEDIINKNRDELESDGFGIRKAEDFISELKFGNKVNKQRGKFLVEVNENEIVSFAPRGVNLFPKRAILRVGMLLQDSSIAKELRTRLLDIIHDTEEKTDIVKDIVTEIRTEQDIQAELLKAIIEGDTNKESLLKTELIGLKQKRIKELEPKANYYDEVLKSKNTMTVTQIAKCYGMTAKGLNEILHKLKVQFKQNGTWVLYKEYDGKGFTRIDTYKYENKIYNTIGTNIQTKWTQVGRKFIHNLLIENGYI